MKLEDWIASGTRIRAWTEFRTKHGLLEVYVRRSIFCPEVVEIANVRSLDGFGGIRPLYRKLFADIPAIAEQVLNPDLDKLLVVWGWDHAYRDLADIPTRVNKAFQQRFPSYREAHTAGQAMMKERTQ